MENQLTPRQIAGAANGRLAAGAKSPEGRARSAANSTKHGLTAQKLQSTKMAKCAIALFNESPAAFDDLCQSLAHCFLPSDTHEMNLVYRMAQAEWLRLRAVHMETAALSEAMRQQAHPFHAHTGSKDLVPTNAEALRAWHAFSKLSSANPAFSSLQRYAAAHARAYAGAERELRDYRIAKAESIHPTPKSVGPTTTLEPTAAPEDRWQPLEATTSPDPTLIEENTEEELLPATELPNTESENTESENTESENTESQLTESENTESQLTESAGTTIAIPENKLDETKVTAELQSNLIIPGRPPQPQQPVTDAAPNEDRVG